MRATGRLTRALAPVLVAMLAVGMAACGSSAGTGAQAAQPNSTLDALSTDQLAAQAAKLGKPVAEAGKNSKTVTPIGDLVRAITAIVPDDVKDAGKGKKGKGDKPAGGSSLLGRLKGLMTKRAAKAK